EGRLLLGSPALCGLAEQLTEFWLGARHQCLLGHNRLPFNAPFGAGVRQARQDFFRHQLSGADSPLRNAAYSQDRATAQQRSEARRTTPRVAAASSSVSPAKKRSLTSSAQAGSTWASLSRASLRSSSSCGGSAREMSMCSSRSRRQPPPRLRRPR